MRVLLLNYEYPPLGGGAGVATAALAHGLVQRGAVADVVTARDGRSDPGADAADTEVAGLNLHKVLTKRKGVHQVGMAGAYGYVLRAAPVIRRLMRRYRYDAAHFFFSLPTGALLPLAGLAGVPVVVSLRGSDVPGYDRSKPTLQRAHRALLPLTRWIWRRADRVVAVCGSLAQLARATQPDLRVDVIPNGVDIDHFRPPPGPRHARLGPLRCIAVARLIQRKGLLDLLRAWSLLERGRYQLEIVGDGPSDALLRSLARELGVESEVHFAGALDRAALAERYRQADLFTLVPFDEAFGNVFAEALASGLPIVGSDIGGIPELVTEGENGFLVPPGEPKALARSLRRLADDAEMRLRMGACNRARAEATLSWDAMTDRYLGLYHELAGVPAAPRPEPAGVSG